MAAQVRAILLATVALLLVGVAVVGWRAHDQLGEAVESARVAYTGSAACADCHAKRHESWHRTFHRTMTQEADATSVRGEFDGKPLTAFGGVVQPVKTDAGFAFKYLDPATGAEQATLPVARARWAVVAISST